MKPQIPAGYLYQPPPTFNLLTSSRSSLPSYKTLNTRVPADRVKVTLTPNMSFQDRAQQQVGQIDKEVCLPAPRRPIIAFLHTKLPVVDSCSLHHDANHVEP